MEYRNKKRMNNANAGRLAKTASIIIKDGGLVILPFDTVYGLICDPFNNSAVEKLFSVKKRSLEKTIGVAVPDIEAFAKYSKIDEDASRLVSSKLPGPYSFIVPIKEQWQSEISSHCVKSKTISIRIPDSEIVREIANLSGGIIAQTSANITGRGECYTVSDVEKQFTEKDLEDVDLIIDGGKIKSSGPSKIIDLTSPGLEQIERV